MFVGYVMSALAHRDVRVKITYRSRQEYHLVTGVLINVVGDEVC